MIQYLAEKALHSLLFAEIQLPMLNQNPQHILSAYKSEARRHYVKGITYGSVLYTS